MKRILAACGVLVFLFVLLIRPFEFLDTLSVHAGHLAHNTSIGEHDGHVSTAVAASTLESEQSSFAAELSNAVSELAEFKTGLWMASLMLIALVTLGLSMHFKEMRHQDKSTKS